jgi:hypothetical protein
MALPSSVSVSGSHMVLLIRKGKPGLELYTQATLAPLLKPFITPDGRFRMAQNNVAINVGWDLQGQLLCLKSIHERCA